MSDLGKWIAMLVGAFTIAGVLVGAGISVGHHLQADTYQDQRLNVLEQRVHDLEGAQRYLHGETGLLPNAPQN